jgi:L-lactate dehydrogenase complex protein LldG
VSGREAILGRIRRAVDGDGQADRRTAAEARIGAAPLGVIPARGQLPDTERVELFVRQAQAAAATVDRVASHEAVPGAVADYLRQRNLPASIRMGADERLSSMPWRDQTALTVLNGPSDGTDATGLSHAFGAVAETGTLVMTSGAANPTTINFLPEHHIVVVEASTIEGDLEKIVAAVRDKFGKGTMPRTVNMITGPSRSGDIEQKLLLGAHGPRALHIVVVDRP